MSAIKRSEEINCIAQKRFEALAIESAEIARGNIELLGSQIRDAETMMRELCP